eukprot:TRINITY_DN96699_c0_g1_i1.p1 TRINITY_DN96699_c0_g1~~TRINITY_DN96699_c0_g1_i1.p1  ORF type:complete len:342 (+),score=57.81 TRINITY_DN96699_c0_g1_i1:161-1186(+)
MATRLHRIVTRLRKHPASMAARRFQAVPLREGSDFGIEFRGADLRRKCMTAELRASLRAAMLSHGLVVVRQQRRLQLGDQMAALGDDSWDCELKRLRQTQLSSRLEAEALAVDRGLQWHADGILSSQHLPVTSIQCSAAWQQSGQIQIASCQKLYDALPVSMKSEVSKAMVRYSKWATVPGAQRRMQPHGLCLADTVPDPRPSDAVYEHPLVRWVVDADGKYRKGLFAVPAFLYSVRFVGGALLDAKASRKWIAQVLSAAGLDSDSDAPGSVHYSHRWRSGDFLFWDNRCVLHRNIAPFSWTGMRLHHILELPGASRSEGPAAATELQAAVDTAIQQRRES